MDRHSDRETDNQISERQIDRDGQPFRDSQMEKETERQQDKTEHPRRCKK